MSRRTKIFIYFALLLVFVTIISTVKLVLPNPDSLDINDSDWNLHLSWSGAAKKSILTYKQLPLWNPYRCGGTPLIGEPESDVLSLFLPFLLFLGPVAGYIVFFFISLAIGLYGFYKLARSYEISRFGSTITSITYMLSGLYIIPFAKGMTNFIVASYIPYLVLTFEGFLKSGKIAYGIMAAFLAAFMFLSGFHYISIILLYFVIRSIIHIAITRNITDVKKLGFILSLFCCFSAIKLLQSIQILTSHAVTYHNTITIGYSVKTLLLSLLSRNQTIEQFQLLGGRNQNFFQGVGWGLEENGMYIGLLLFVFCIFGLLQKKRYLLEQYIIFFFFLIIAFGTNIHPGPYEFLNKLPFVSVMRVAQRYRYIFMVPFALFAGVGFDVFVQFIKRKFNLQNSTFKIASIVLIVIITIDLVYINTQVFHEGFVVEKIQINPSQSFTQRCVDSPDPEEKHKEYPLLVNNYGRVNCISNVLFRTFPLCENGQNYTGEAYLYHALHQVPITKFSPNQLEVSVMTTGDDVLVINQNYTQDWHVIVNGIRTPSQQVNGLLGVSLAPGTHTVIFYYFPLTLLLGGIVTIISIAASLCYLIFYSIQTRSDRK